MKVAVQLISLAPGFSRVCAIGIAFRRFSGIAVAETAEAVEDVRDGSSTRLKPGANERRVAFGSGVGTAAFTLLEVMLAVVILTGLLAIVLFFYQQASRFRTDLLEETERISAARLLMERISTELRCARRHSFFAVPLVGDSASLQFITVGLPAVTSWTGEQYGRASRPETDLKLVRYTTAASEDGTNVAGLSRSEEPLVQFRTVTRATSETFREGEPAVKKKNTAMLLTEQLRFLRFRYWDGKGWQESWSDTRLPAGVEITIGADALPVEEEEVVELPKDTFRRVVYLPGSAAPAPLGSSDGGTNTTQSVEVPL